MQRTCETRQDSTSCLVRPKACLGVSVSSVDIQHMEDVAANWRKVASTHDFKELLKEGTAVTPSAYEAELQTWIDDWHNRLHVGAFLLLISLCIVGTACTKVALSHMPPASSPILELIQQDWYYCYALPGIIPVSVLMVWTIWFSLKMFKHNG